MMRESITGNYYDLLKFFGYGSYNKLIRSLHTTLKHFDIDADSQGFNKYRMQTSLFLNTFGLLEIDVDKPKNLSWSTCQEYIVSIDATKKRFIGGSGLANRFCEAIGESNITFYPSINKRSKSFSHPHLFPDFPETTMSDLSAKDLAEQLGCNWIEAPFRTISQFLPLLENIARSLYTPVEFSLRSDDLERFTISKGRISWDSEVTNHYQSSGIFRQPRVDARHNYYVVSRKDSVMKIFRVESVDWLYLIAFWLMGERMECFYDIKDQIFSVPSYLRFPALIERLLVSCSFVLPFFNGRDQRQYPQVEETVIDGIARSIPVLNIVRI